MNNGYITYMLRILAAQGALASVYTDPEDPEGFSAGFVEAADGSHVLMCDLTPWGQIEGWRVRRNQDVLNVLYGEEYEQRLGMLLAHHRQHHRPFFADLPAEDTDLLLSVLLECRSRGEIVSIIEGDDMVTGRVVEANGLRVKLRIFEDEAGRMNRNLEQVGGSLLVVSQFTLYADTSSRRPGFTGAAKPEIAEPLYQRFMARCRERGFDVQHGEFGAEMEVDSLTHGPVTILLDTEA